MNSTVHASNVLPKVGVKLWNFPDKKNPSKIWWGWTIEVFSYDTNGLPVIFKTLESHQLGKKSRLWDSEEKAQKDSREMFAKVEKIVQSAFDRGQRMGKLKLVGAGSILE